MGTTLLPVSPLDGALEPEDLCNGHAGLEELDLVGAVVVVLVLAPPQRDVHLRCEGRVFLEDPPPVPHTLPCLQAQCWGLRGSPGPLQDSRLLAG